MPDDGSARPDLSIVIPAFREGAFFAASLDELRAFVAERTRTSEVIVVDDGSDDDTAEVARSYAPDWPAGSRLRVLVHPRNQGKGGAVRTGMMTAQGEYCVFTDADLAYGTAAIEQVRDALATRADVVCGRRERHVGALRSVTGWGFAAAVRLAGLGVVGTNDTQCGIKGFRQDAAAVIFGLTTVRGFAFDVEVLHICARMGLTVDFVPVVQRTSTHSSMNPVRDARRMLVSLREIREVDRAGGYEVPAPKPRFRKNVET